MSDPNNINNQPFYIAPQNPLYLELIDLKRENKFVVSARNALANPGSVYTLAHDEVSVPQIQMIAQPTFAALVAGLDPTKSLPILMAPIQVPVVATAQRLVEFYHIILGLSLFPGETDPGHEYIDSFGFQYKILKTGQRVSIQTKSVIASGGNVVADYPILQDGNVAAFLTNGTPLTVNSIVNANLGVVSLNNGVSPIADGTAVELVYDTQLYVPVNVFDSQRNNIPAVMLTDAMAAYLQANQ